MSGMQAIDEEILLFFQEHLRAVWMNDFWRSVTFLGNGGWFWIATALVLACFRKTRRIGETAMLSMALGFLLTNLCLKNVIARPRPFEEISAVIPLIAKPQDFSFPSGHTTVSFACGLVYFHRLPRRYGVPALTLAGMIAFSRLYLGVHYPSDILGGFLVALVASEGAMKAEKKQKEKDII